MPVSAPPPPSDASAAPVAGGALSALLPSATPAPGAGPAPAFEQFLPKPKAVVAAKAGLVPANISTNASANVSANAPAMPSPSGPVLRRARPAPAANGVTPAPDPAPYSVSSPTALATT